MPFSYKFIRLYLKLCFVEISYTSELSTIKFFLEIYNEDENKKENEKEEEENSKLIYKETIKHFLEALRNKKNNYKLVLYNELLMEYNAKNDLLYCNKNTNTNLNDLLITFKNGKEIQNIFENIIIDFNSFNDYFHNNINEFILQDKGKNPEKWKLFEIRENQDDRTGYLHYKLSKKFLRNINGVNYHKNLAK